MTAEERPAPPLNDPRERTTVAKAWAEFERVVLPESASQIQRCEMRRAWYAGVEWFMTGLIASLDADSDPTQGDLEYMASVQEELNTFARRVAEGIS